MNDKNRDEWLAIVVGDDGKGTWYYMAYIKRVLRSRRDDTAWRVRFMNALHVAVGRKGRVPEIKRNKLDVALVSDFDCIDANEAEYIEAILRAEGKWVNE